jgi:nicotinic acid phosphoribosyltransferase
VAYGYARVYPMSDTPTPKTASQSEAFLAVVEAIGDALFILLTDETTTEDEAEALNADLNEVAFLAIDAFDPQIVSTSIDDVGTKRFTFQMTIPDEDVFDIIQNRYREIVGED